MITPETHLYYSVIYPDVVFHSKSGDMFELNCPSVRSDRVTLSDLLAQLKEVYKIVYRLYLIGSGYIIRAC